MEQLRLQTNIPDPVIYISEEPDTPPCLYRTIAGREDRDLIIQHRDVFAVALRVADKLIASKQRQAKVATRSQTSNSDSSALNTKSTATLSSSDFFTTTTVNGVNRGASVRPRTSPQFTSGGDRRKKKSKRQVQQDTKRVSNEGLGRPAKQSHKQDKAKVCEYCSRKGHTSATCYAKTDNLRQERLIQRLLAVEKHTATLFSPAVHQSTHPFTMLQSLPQPRSLLAQPGVWNQSQVWQWTSPLHQYQQSVADPNYHLGLAVLAHYRPSPWYNQLAPNAH
ncbi:hypothetical protein E2C01_037289 [Portunus trituberculatus]|uniref:CCHC-type domain-containing protein n=1 Tax=Portunus trituberculatus TaxID=210409 RepID=A0A5B7FDL3_PORTR|nr:hypothetical protein [Portunus trituberculatus]